MFKLFFLILTSLVSCALSPALADADTKPPFPVIADFVTFPDFLNPALSPSGRYLSGIAVSEDKISFSVIDLTTEDRTPEIVELDTFVPLASNWITDDRLIMTVQGYVDLNASEVGFIPIADLQSGNFQGHPLAVTRMIALDRDGSNRLMLLSDKRDFKHSIHNANLISLIHDDKDHILMVARFQRDLDLFKVNVMTGAYERTGLGTHRTIAWMVDRAGEPAFRLNMNRRGTKVYIYARHDRDNGKINWKKIKTIELNEMDEMIDAAPQFNLLGPGPTPSTYYVAARLDGTETAGIYLYDLEKDAYVETISIHPDFDIENVLFTQSTNAFMGAYYFEDHLTFDMVDPDLQAHIDDLQASFGETTNLFPLQTSEDGKIWLLDTTGPTDPGTFRIYDAETGSVYPIASQYEALSRKQLADTRVIRYQARDGLALTGYLTRPAGLTEGEIPPLIVMPHGGPEQRDSISFDFEVQLLAAYGYQVFQPNFRGSSGYGQTFADRGRRQWGLGMQTDTEDGFLHLVELGLAAPDQACIVGSSYGGYAALAAITLTPDLYQCGVSFAGISDLSLFIETVGSAYGTDSDVYEYWVRHIGHPKNDADQLRAMSPVNLVEQIRVPVLLVHGEDDKIVSIEQSRSMKRAMDASGKTAKFITLKNSGHAHYGEGQETRYYLTLITFLQQHLPSARYSLPAGYRIDDPTRPRPSDHSNTDSRANPSRSSD
ncbi:alpha/beta hydrolase family protein [Ponticaulis profundi]|uniref:Alpha/beta hydrolase family protein n=1 Tax=Ponticaulis profundi TaxID=2665222 RepID=A0ABW1S6W4_9PROT